MKNWFIIQSHSSFENKVAMQIREEADKNKVSDNDIFNKFGVYGSLQLQF